MAQYKTESHFRSLVKGISWRIVATSDTVLVVLLVTCLSGHCSLENAIKIGLVEFLIKFAIYYIHERIWQRAYRNGVVSKWESVYKSVTWRLVATTTTFIISGAVLERFDEIALYIALTELFTKFVLFYIHERLWLRIPLGRVRKIFENKE